MPNPSPQRTLVRFIFSLPLAIAAAVWLFPKRSLLVDVTKVPSYPEQIPWYYAPIHCEHMPPWNMVYTGDAFCIGLDVRLLVLVPLALACIFTWLWEKLRS